MNTLPYSNTLPVQKLSSLFEDTSASYKFLLFKAIFDSVREGKSELRFDDLAIRSISQAWYSIHFYKLSYGHSDRMTRWVQELDAELADSVLISDLSYSKIYEVLTELRSGELSHGGVSSYLEKYIREFQKLVPYRLITPWFRNELRGKKDSFKNSLICELSAREEYQSLYSIDNSSKYLCLSVNEAWISYLNSNLSIIEGWWKYSFILYLQKNNPTVLSISTKLDPPISRNTSKVAKLYEKYYLKTGIEKTCFYSGEKLESISHDHFLPWSFLGSDPIYNFVPSLKSVNSSKSNIIPDKSYMGEFSTFQYAIFKYLLEFDQKSTILESFIADLHLDSDMPIEIFSEKVETFYSPLFLTAENQGFGTDWLYKKMENKE
jgi:hypothetical protein